MRTARRGVSPARSNSEVTNDYGNESVTESDGCILHPHEKTSVKEYDVNQSGSHSKCGEIHVLLHPAYSFPYPYIRVWHESSGELLTINELQQLMGGSSIRRINELHKDNRHHIWNDFISDMHPFFDIPWNTLHLCAVQDIMTQLSRKSGRKLLFPPGQRLLIWLSQVFIAFEMSIPPHVYRAMEESMFEQDHFCEGH